MQYFSIIGYVSVLMGLTVPLLWLLHLKGLSRPTPPKQAGGVRQWLCHIALAVALLAYLFAFVNSRTYVNRIQLDQRAEIAAVQAKLDEARKAAEQSRSGEVAQIRFAEDAAGDYLDAGGMDSADLKYMEKVNQAVEPAWKKNKKQRSAGGQEDESLDSLVGGQAGSKAVALEPSVEENAVMMKASDKAMADRLDAANLKLIRLLILLAVLFVVLDYLRRANRYAEAYLPLPLPSAWLNGISPMPPISLRPTPARRTLPEELAWLIRRGDAFVYLTNDPWAADKIPSTLPRLGKRAWPTDVLRVRSGTDEMSDDFIFETLWYGRSSFVVDTSQRVKQMLDRFNILLAERRACRAKVAQTVHVIWDCGQPPDEAWRTEFVKLAKATGLTLVVCDASHQSSVTT